MTDTISTPAVRQIEVPASARALATLSRIDYEDAFLVALRPAEDRSPEALARAVLEDAPVALRGTLLSGWSALGLKLDPARSERAVLGWPVRAATERHVLLGAGSRTGMPAELLFLRDGGELLFATFVHHGNAAARALWAGVEPVHVPIVRRLLGQASRRWGA